MLKTRRTGGESSNARLLGGVLIRTPPFEEKITEQEGTCCCDLHTNQGDSASMSCRNIEASYFMFRKQRLAISYQSPKALYMLSLVVCVSGVVRIAIVAQPRRRHFLICRAPSGIGRPI